MRRSGLAAGMLLLSVLAPGPHPMAAATACASLAALELPHARITAAREVAPGAFSPGGTVPPAAARSYAALPAFCQVQAALSPTADSDIRIEVWMPATGWNHRFQAVGNGGWAGTISYSALAAAVARGYAGASTDTGHATPGAAFAAGHPQKLVDYAYRAVHEMTVQAKALVHAYYGEAPNVAIWNGCSTGGRQGATEASRYPDDFDGIIAGAAPDPSARLHAIRLAANLFVNRSADSALTPEKLALLHRGVVEACDAGDGVKDGVLEDPQRCRFDPKALQCASGDAPTCLTAAQVQTANYLYSDVRDPATGQVRYPPLLQRGSELQWRTLAGPEPYAIAVEAYRLALGSPQWDWHSYTPADRGRVEQALAVINSASPDLTRFVGRGGKLLMYHGWNDQQVPAMSSVSYYTRVLDKVGQQAAGKSIQLYMVPGMTHCQGGEGTDSFDKVAAMESWIATGRAPARIAASHMTNGRVDRTRPLCPYPQVARYKGTGSTDDEQNFTCER